MPLITPIDPVAGLDDLECVVQSSDSDGDSVNLQYAWTLNGAPTTYATSTIPMTLPMEKYGSVRLPVTMEQVWAIVYRRLQRLAPTMLMQLGLSFVQRETLSQTVATRCKPALPVNL